MNKTLTVGVIGICGLLVAVTYAPSTIGAEWGSLKGRFVVDGKPAEPPPLPVDSKEPYCVQQKPKNEAWIVAEDGALKNGVVYLRLGRRDKVAIHPDYEAQLKEPAVLDNNRCNFVPHISLVRVGQTLLIKNSDPPPVGHNTNLGLLFGFNQIIPAGGEAPVKVTKAAPLPMPVTCNIHPFMKGHVLSLEHPYMATSGDDGAFEIKDLPAGMHEFQFWHETGYLRDLKLNEGKTNRQGRIDLTIAAGKTLDLGDIKIPARMLK